MMGLVGITNLGPILMRKRRATPRARVRAASSDDPTTKPSSPAVATAGRVLLQSVSVRRRGLTDVIAIEVTAKDPQRAAQIANTYAEAYLEEQVAAKSPESNGRALQFPDAWLT